MSALRTLLNNFRISKDDKNTPSTHTRMPDKDLNIYGGSYNVSNKDEKQFYNTLYEDLILKNEKEYLTEKQLENGCLAVDLDFRYNHDVTCRQHTRETLDDLVSLFIEQIEKFSVLDNAFKVYAMEKPNVNRLQDGSLTKDGIHLLFTFAMTKEQKQLIRNEVLKEITTIDLPLINTWDSVIDKGVIEGTCNWTVYGCQKPANEAYKLVKIYDYTIDPTDGNLMVDMIENPELTKDMYIDLSVRKQRPAVKPNKIALSKLTKLQLPDNKSSPRSVAELDTATKDKYIELLNICGSSETKILHPDWYCIVSFLKTHGYDKSICQEFTEKFVNNKLSELDNIWDKHIKIETPMNPKAIENITYKFNPTGLASWKLKYPEKNYITTPDKIIDIYLCSKLIAPYLNETIKLCNNEWWALGNNNLWSLIKEPTLFMVAEIRKYIDHSNADLTNKIKNMPDGEEKNEKLKISKTYLSLYTEINKGSYTTQLVKFLRPQLVDDNFTEKLNINVNQVVYKNGIYDLTTLTLRPYILPTDYISHTIPYDYQPASDNDKKIIKAELLKICNNKEKHLEYYLNALGYAMTGDSIKFQEFYYLMGVKACNGKSVIFDALGDIIPNYIVKIESTALELNNQQLHKEVSTWRGKRIGWVNELSKRKQDCDVIKQIADGMPIKYKIMYGGSGNMNVNFKLFIVSNHSISIDGDKGIARRLKMMELDSEFIDGLEKDDPVNCRFKKDNNFGVDLRNKYKYALMDLIYEYSNKIIINEKFCEYPTEWNEETNETIKDNNKFKDFFDKWFVVDKDAVVGKRVVDDIVKMFGVDIKIREELKRMGVWYEYDSTKKAPKERMQGKYIGFRARTEEELKNEEDEIS
jgi:phage/plasmid-associated DNA primase